MLLALFRKWFRKSEPQNWHYQHHDYPAALIELGGVPFFVDSVGPLDDVRVGQMLCGAALRAGQEMGWRDRLLDAIEGRYRNHGARPLGRME